MKKTIKNLLLMGSMLLVGSAQLQAAPATVTYSGTNNYGYLLTGVGEMNTIYIYNPTTNVANVSVYDSPTNVLAWTNLAYSNYVYSTVTYTNIYTNIFGVITTNSYAAETNTINVVATGANSYRVIANLTVPGLSQASYPVKCVYVNGLFTTNTGSASASNLVVIADVSKRQ